MINHKNEDAVLVIGDNIFSKSGMKELKKDLEISGIFQRIEILKFIEGAYTNPYKITKEADIEKLDQYILYNEQWVEQWMEKKKIVLSDFTEFNLAIDHRHLGLYLLSKKIPYQYFEDGNGLLSRKEEQLQFHKKSQYVSYVICKQLHALGANDAVTKKYANESAQIEGFFDSKMEDFNVLELFQRLEKQDKEKIFQMFHAQKITIKNEKMPVLYLTRYVRYLQDPTMQNHHFLSSMIADLFAKDHPLIIKPHPRDFTGRYHEIFKNALVLPKQFPSELLPFLYDGVYEKIITTGSTAIDALREYGKEVIKLDIQFENKIYAIYRYIAAVLFIREVFPDIKQDEIGVTGCSMETMGPLCKEFLGIRGNSITDWKKKYRVVIMDETDGKKIDAECICYLNSKNNYQFADSIATGFKNIHYLSVMVRQTKDNAIGKNEEHAIFINTKNEEIIQKTEKIVLNLPRMKKHISPNDIRMMKELLQRVKKEGNFNESNSICANETK